MIYCDKCRTFCCFAANTGKPEDAHKHLKDGYDMFGAKLMTPEEQRGEETQCTKNQ